MKDVSNNVDGRAAPDSEQEDSQDILISEARENEPTISWESLKAEVE